MTDDDLFDAPPAPTLDDLARRTVAWRARTPMAGEPLHETFRCLNDEVEELVAAIREVAGGHREQRAPAANIDDVASEAYDVLVLLLASINHVGIGVEDLIRVGHEKLRTNQGRSWHRVDGRWRHRSGFLVIDDPRPIETLTPEKMAAVRTWWKDASPTRFKPPPSFVDGCLDGTVRPEEFDDYVDRWHGNDVKATLAAYLGFSEAQYKRVALSGQNLLAVLQEIADERGVPAPWL